MTLFQEGNTVSNNKVIFPVALKTIIIKYSKYNFNSNFMKRTFHYSGTILWNSLPPNLKLIQDIDLFKKKYTDYSMSKQNNEWFIYSLYQGFILDYTNLVLGEQISLCRWS
jgi:hypothetical protein